MPPPKKYHKREANLGALIEKLEIMQDELGGNGMSFVKILGHEDHSYSWTSL
jgi:hypothetical protein